MRNLYCALPLIVVCTMMSGCSSFGRTAVRSLDPAGLSDEWRTLAERSDYQETCRYDECVAFCRKLADESPFVHYTSFGLSGEGRELPLLVLSTDRAFSPEKAHRDGKIVMLVENCIHPGECCGKDACLELARNMALRGDELNLLEHVNLLIIPIFGTDGHERFGPYNRINQNGPREMGWRVTAANFNLNRDFVKADSVEMRAWLKLWREWRPDVFFDIHATNGSDHQHAIFYAATTTQLAAEPIVDWTNDVLRTAVLPGLEADGHNPFPYGGPADMRDLSKGIRSWCSATPRYSHGYGAVCDRPSFLLELHAHKTYGRRVRAAYDMVVHTLESLNRDPEALRAAIVQADRRAVESRGTYGDTGEVVLRVDLADESEPATYKAVEYSYRQSDITGGEIVEYSDVPMDVETKLYNQTRIVQSIAPPAAYLVPPQWGEVIERLKWHGIECFELTSPATLDVDSYRFEDMKFPERPYESRFLPSYTTIAIHESREYLPGTVVVPLDQRRAKLAVHMLEPDAPDSLLRWGLLNIIFEKKEYASDFVLEPIAQRMLEEDPELKREFEAKLAADEEFAKDAWARLNCFYRRTPYWDQRHNVYPIARLMDERALNELRAYSK